MALIHLYLWKVVNSLGFNFYKKKAVSTLPITLAARIFARVEIGN